jgi:hypothetical protein
MGLSADEFRTLARNCLRDALFSRDEEGKQMLLDIADQYNQRAAHLDAYCTVRLDRLG